LRVGRVRAIVDGMKSELDKRAGLTLIEVLLAALILGLSMTVLLTAMSRCMLLFQTVHRYHDAMAVLGEAEVDFPLAGLAQRRDLTPEDLEVLGEDYGRFTFSRTVEDPEALEADADQARLLVVRSRVGWSERGRERAEEVKRYVFYQPRR